MGDGGFAYPGLAYEGESFARFNGETYTTKNILATFFGVLEPDIFKLDLASDLGEMYRLIDLDQFRFLIENLEVVPDSNHGIFYLPKDPVQIPERLFDHFDIGNEKNNHADGDLLGQAEKKDVSIDSDSPNID